MAELANRVQETSTTTGTGTLTLSGAVTGYVTFNSSFTNGDVVFYTIDDGLGNWEIGAGTVGSSTLTRTTVIESSNANALVPFASGVKRVFCTAPSIALLPDQTGNNTKILTTNGTSPSWITAASGTVTSVSVASANGLAGTSSGGATPSLTLSTTVTGLLKGDGTAISAASSGTDYIAPSGALGTPASGTLTNCTGLPVSTGVSGLGANVATFLATPSSANLAAAVTDETGSGSLVFGTSPTITTGTYTGLRETRTAPTISAGTLTLDCSAGNVFSVALNASITTLAFTNIPASGTAYALTLSFTADGTARTVAWGAAVKWPGGTAPTLTSTSGKVDTFVLTTWDAGTTWFAFVAGQAS